MPPPEYTQTHSPPSLACANGKTTVLNYLMSIMFFVCLQTPFKHTHIGMHTGAWRSLICLYALPSMPASCRLLISESSPALTPCLTPFLCILFPVSSNHSFRQTGRKEEGKCSQCICVCSIGEKCHFVRTFWSCVDILPGPQKFKEGFLG